MSRILSLLQKPGHALECILHELLAERDGREETLEAMWDTWIDIYLCRRAVLLQSAFEDDGFVSQRVHSTDLEYMSAQERSNRRIMSKRTCRYVAGRVL